MSSSASMDSLSSSSSVSAPSNAGDYDEEYRVAQREWEESLEQLRTIVSIVLLPVIGKWLGRKCSNWLYTRYLSVGLTKTFFFGGSKAAK